MITVNINKILTCSIRDSRTQWLLCVWLGFFVPYTRIETSPWPVKGFKFWQMLGTHGIEQWGFSSVSRLGFEHPTFRLNASSNYYIYLKKYINSLYPHSNPSRKKLLVTQWKFIIENSYMKSRHELFMLDIYLSHVCLCTH